MSAPVPKAGHPSRDVGGRQHLVVVFDLRLVWRQCNAKAEHAVGGGGVTHKTWFSGETRFSIHVLLAYL